MVGGTFTDLWVYFVGPPLGALSVALLYRHRRSTVACAKLYHTDSVVCRFVDCQYTASSQRIVMRRAGLMETRAETAGDDDEFARADRPAFTGSAAAH